MNWLTIVVICGLAIWWFKPLRVYLVERTNLTVKVLLVAFPSLFLVRLGYGIYKGEQQENWFVVAMTVTALLLLWLALVFIGNWLERRRPTKARAPDLAVLSRLPGMPHIPGAVTSPQVQQAARAAAEAASRVDWSNVATSVGRASGRWVARARKGSQSDASR